MQVGILQYIYQTYHTHCQVKEGQVLVIRYEGPKGRCGFNSEALLPSLTSSSPLPLSLSFLPLLPSSSSSPLPFLPPPLSFLFFVLLSPSFLPSPSPHSHSPGMPEMLSPGAALVGAGLGKKVALVTDGRFSGASHGERRKSSVLWCTMVY